ncbi:hypothetical protein [Pseudomonas sp. TE3610]
MNNLKLLVRDEQDSVPHAVEHQVQVNFTEDGHDLAWTGSARRIFLSIPGNYSQFYGVSNQGIGSPAFMIESNLLWAEGIYDITQSGLTRAIYGTDLGNGVTGDFGIGKLVILRLINLPDNIEITAEVTFEWRNAVGKRCGAKMIIAPLHS